MRDAFSTLSFHHAPHWEKQGQLVHVTNLPIKVMLAKIYKCTHAGMHYALYMLHFLIPPLLGHELILQSSELLCLYKLRHTWFAGCMAKGSNNEMLQNLTSLGIVAQ